MTDEQRPRLEGLAGQDLPELTAQQQAFVEGLCAGMTGTDAYIAAYDCANMSRRTIWAEASRLRADPKVAAWLTAARVACLGTAVVTREGHLRELERLRELSIKGNALPSAVAAEVARGKAAGLYVESVELNVSRYDTTAALDVVAAHDPALAAKLAAQYKIPWQHSESETKH